MKCVNRLIISDHAKAIDSRNDEKDTGGIEQDFKKTSYVDSKNNLKNEVNHYFLNS